MMRKVVTAIIILFSLSGCEKFLNVNPINKAYEDELFSDRSGFEALLAGVYYGMSSQALFGKEMKHGFLETLAGTYLNMSASHTYYRSSRHQYDYDFPIRVINRIWTDSYNLINQTNIILKNIDAIKGDEYYDLIKGEALGVKCFMHFQLLKLFGPVIKEEGLQVAAIPYKEKIEYVGGQYPTTEVFLEKLENDLAQAREFLINDPLRTNARVANLNAFSYERYNSLIDNRGNRMNYYAVVAMQAMVAQWKGDLLQARKYAEELLEEFRTTQPTIRLITRSELDQEIHKRFPMENIFSLINPKILEYTLTIHTLIADDRGTGTSPFLFPDYNFLKNNLYNIGEIGSLNDFRLLNWFGRLNETSFNWKLTKNIFDPTALYNEVDYNPLYENKLISIHTIYMIAAEEYAKSDPSKAVDYLNLVRRARNVTNNVVYKSEMTEEFILNLIFDEMRKDNVDDGYMFTEYKRQFRTIHRSVPVKPSLAIFKFPIPAEEQLYNPQK